MYLAIDLGGTKTLVCLLSKDGEIKKAVKFPTPRNYHEFTSSIKKTIDEITESQSISQVCMAIPGRIDRENGIIISLGNLDWPKDIPIRADLSQFLQCPIIIENDANLAGLSEALLVKDDYKNSLYITVSTGIGGGYVTDGKLNEATLDAEIGHMVFEYEGKMTDWEDFASGSWIVKTYNQRASELEDDEAWNKISKNLAIGFVNVSSVLTPDIIIVGGGVGTHLPKFKEKLDKHIQNIASNMSRIPSIIQAQKPEEAVIHGCYELIKQKEAE